MRFAPEFFRTTQELKQDLAALKLCLAFQEMEEREIERMLIEVAADAELDVAVQRSSPRILRQIRSGLRQQKGGRTLVHVLSRTGRVAAAFLLAIFVAFSAAMAVSSSARATVLRFVVNIADTYTELSLNDSVAQIQVPPEWCGRYYPSYIPKGYSLTEVFPYPCEAYFESTDGLRLSFCEYDSSTYTSIDTEDAEIHSIPLHGTTALISQKESNLFVVWSKDSRYFIVSISQWSNPSADVSESLGDAIKVASSTHIIQ